MGYRLSRGLERLEKRFGGSRRSWEPEDEQPERIGPEWDNRLQNFDSLWVRTHERAAKGHNLGTLVFIHGLGMAARSFIPLVEPLLDNHRIVLIDLPGFAGLPHPPEPLTMDEYARAVVDACKAVGEEHVTLIGHSMGCQIAMSAAPDLKTRSIILIAPPDTSVPLPLTAARFLRTSLREPQLARRSAVSNYLWSGVHSTLEVIPLLLDYDLLEAVRQIDEPVLVIRGQWDRVCHAQWAHKLAGLTGGSATTIPGAAHSMIFDHHEQLRQKIHHASC